MHKSETSAKQMMSDERIRQASMICAIAVAFIALILPFVASGYGTFQASMIFVYAIAVIGLNLLTGYAGQISLGHGAFYAIGAYTSAYLVTQDLLPYWASLPFAGAICAVFGYLFSFPALRLRGHYLALATFALAIALPKLIRYDGFSSVTNGSLGIVLPKPQSPAGIGLNDDQWIYFFCLLVFGLVFVSSRNLVRGQFGSSLIAVRDNETAAVAMGINISSVKTTAFAISAFFTGVAGGLAAIVVQFVSPESFDFLLSISLLIGVVIGGAATGWGPLVGAIFITLVPNYAASIAPPMPWALYGGAIILTMYFAPGGLTTVPGRVIRWLRQKA